MPQLVWDHLLQGAASVADPSARQLFGCVGIADISGFTGLTEALAEHGDEGAELVQRILNSYFGTLIDVVTEHGGEVIRFAGDAAFSLWHADDSSDLRDATKAAARCAEVLRRNLDGRRIESNPPLRLRQALGAGKLWALQVGGVEGRWEFLLSGAGLQRACTALAEARPGSIVVSDDQDTPGDPQTGKPAGEAAETDAAATGSSRTASSLACYLPRALRGRLLGADHSTWLGEFRTATVLFVNVPELADFKPQRFELLQQAVVSMQSCVYRYGGSINRVLVDDKGFVVIAAWGIALHAHEDDATRAVRAAQDLRRRLRLLGLDARSGLATGRIYTGVFGNLHRADYALIGKVVNRAARLMEAARPTLCDDATRAAAGANVPLEALLPIELRGTRGKTPIYRPVPSDPGAGRLGGLLGRHRELDLLRTELEAAANDSACHTIILEGEQGIGKICPGERDRRRIAGIALCRAAGDRGRHRRILVVFGLAPDFPAPSGSRGSGRSGSSTAPDSGAPGVRRWTGGTRFPTESGRRNRAVDHDSLTALDAPSYARRTRELLVRILKHYVRRGPLLLVLEDAHWLDSASWALADAFTARWHRLSC